jgi:hypothetical protein
MARICKVAIVVAGSAAIALGVQGTSATASADAGGPHVPAAFGLADPALASPTPSVPDTWVLTVGANEYVGAPPLEVAEADAIAVDRGLGAAGVPRDHRVQLLGPDLTARNLEAAIAWLVDTAGADDDIVLFVAGHAQSEGETQTLLTSDGRRIDDVDLAKWLEPVEAEMWIIFATCHGGGFDELLKPRRTLTAAASATDLAYENLDTGYSYLVEYLFNRNLKASGAQIDVDEVFEAGVHELQREHPDRLPLNIGSPGTHIAAR